MKMKYGLLELWIYGESHLKGGTIKNNAKGRAVVNRGYTAIGNSSSNKTTDIVIQSNSEEKLYSTVYGVTELDLKEFGYGKVRKTVFISGNIKNTGGGYAIYNSSETEGTWEGKKIISGQRTWSPEDNVDFGK